MKLLLIPLLASCSYIVNPIEDLQYEGNYFQHDTVTRTCYYDSITGYDSIGREIHKSFNTKVHGEDTAWWSFKDSIVKAKYKFFEHYDCQNDIPIYFYREDRGRYWIEDRVFNMLIYTDVIVNPNDSTNWYLRDGHKNPLLLEFTIDIWQRDTVHMTPILGNYGPSFEGVRY